MANELLYSADKDRLLQELAVASESSTRLPAMEPAEDVEALHDLFGQVVGLPKETDEEEEKIVVPKLTNNQLKAMKTVSGKLQSPKVSFFKKLSGVYIKAWCFIKSMFEARETARGVCRNSGHVCMHCGDKLPYQEEKGWYDRVNEKITQKRDS